MKGTFFILLIITLLNSCIEKQEIKKSNPIENSTIKVSTKLAPKKGDTISLNVELKKILHSLKKDDYNYRIEKFEVQDSNITGISILVRIF